MSRINEIDAQIATLQQEKLSIEQKLKEKDLIDFDGTREGWLKLIKYLNGSDHEIKYKGYRDNLYKIYFDDFIYDATEGNEFSIPNWLIKVKEVESGREGDYQKDIYVILELWNVAPYLCSRPEIHSYWRIGGYYESYSGNEYNIQDIHQVKPVERPVIFWEPLTKEDMKVKNV